MGLTRCIAAGAILGLVVASHPAVQTGGDCSAVDGECSEVGEGPQSGRVLLQARVEQRQKQEAVAAIDQEGLELELRSSMNTTFKGLLNETMLAQILSSGELGWLSHKAVMAMSKCVFVTCVNIFDEHRERNCNQCQHDSITSMRNAEVGVNGVLGGYVMDGLSILNGGSRDSFAKSFCPDGKVEGCGEKHNFPGEGTTSVQGWDRVAEHLRQVPEKQWKGEWWRGNEFGFIINNPFFWSWNNIDPYSSTAGMLPSQHAAIRPIMEQMFTLHCDDKRLEVQAIVTTEIQNFLAHRKKHGLKVPDDIKALVHQILNRVALNRHVSFEYAKKFVEVQSQVIGLASVSQILPDGLYEFLMPIRQHVGNFVQEYKAIIEKNKGWVEHLRAQDCAPSRDCVDQAASMIFDTFYAVGGLTVPTTISTGIGILLSDDSSNPFKKGSFSRQEALSFYWENVRFFPPVSGFAVWDKRPTCEGLSESKTANMNRAEGATMACPIGKANEKTQFGKVNQYKDGTRVVLNLALAQADPAQWGSNADSFVVRPLADYGKSLGFAELAVDKSVKGGKMDRACPGKELALMIGSTFFELFRAGDWKKPRMPIKFKNGPNYVEDFTLSSWDMVKECREICVSCTWPSCALPAAACHKDNVICSSPETIQRLDREAGKAWEAAKEATENAWNGAKDATENAWNGAKDTADKTWNRLKGWR